MKNAYQRKKDPEAIRRKILDNTMQLAAEQGVGGVSLQMVADLTGVTKGGVLHHFASKQLLLEAMLNDVMQQLSQTIDELMANDPVFHGRFTRAYITVTLDSKTSEAEYYWDAISMTMLTVPSLNAIWTQWFEQRLELHKDSDQAADLKILRYAADGVWLTGFAEMQQPEDFNQMKQELITRTYTAVPVT